MMTSLGSQSGIELFNIDMSEIEEFMKENPEIRSYRILSIPRSNLRRLDFFYSHKEIESQKVCSLIREKFIK